MKRSISKLLFGIILFPIYLVSYLIPRSKDIWIFGSWYGKQYNDNTSYLFEYVVDVRSDIKAIWLTKNNKIIHNMREKGYNVFHANSIQGFWYGSRAGVTLINCGYDDVNKYCVNRSFIVQLWHGVPLKKIKSDDRINENIKRSIILILIRNLLLKLLPFLNERYDLIISSGMKVTDRFESAFNINRDKIVETGFPRMDIITSYESAYDKDILYRKELINKCILYAPTHRRVGFGDNSYFTSLSFKNFNKFLKDNEAILLIKMHYYEQGKIKIFSENNYSNITLLDNHNLSDINRILYHVDLLITDYSSVFYDYLVLDRPILFSPFDLKEYQQIDREFYEDYNSSTPGIKCCDWDEIQCQLEKYFLNEDSFQLKRKKIFKEYYRFSDNQNCLRVINTVANYL